MTRGRWLMACGALVGVLATTTGTKASNLNKLEYLTFSAPVALPGVTLKPGAYSFEIANPDGGQVVLVRERMSHNPVFLGFTNRIERSRVRGAASLVLGEARRGEPSPIIAWYPDSDAVGREFIYR